MNITNTTYIYALCDPITFEVRYVGKANNPYKRFYGHRGHLMDKKQNHKVYWIALLRRKGLKPIMQILEQCDKNAWQERERSWISFYKNVCKNDLTNGTEGGDGATGPRKLYKQKLPFRHSQATKLKMSEKKKNKRLSKPRKLPKINKWKAFNHIPPKPLSCLKGLNKGRFGRNVILQAQLLRMAKKIKHEQNSLRQST
jgi:hypothetical protein